MRMPMRKSRMEGDGTEPYPSDSYSDDRESESSTRKDSRRDCTSARGEELRPWEMPASYSQHIFIHSEPRQPSWMASQKKDTRPWPKQLIDSFKRDPHRHIIDPIIERHDEEMHTVGVDPAWVAANTANTGLVRKLKGRHLQMIAIGGSIGE